MFEIRNIPNRHVLLRTISFRKVLKSQRVPKYRKSLTKNNSILIGHLGGFRQKYNFSREECKLFCLSYPIKVINRIQSMYFYKIIIIKM